MNKRQFLKVGALTVAGLVVAPVTMANTVKIPTSLDRINVRRLMVLLKKEMETVSHHYIFEPSNEKTRNRFENSLLSTLGEFHRRGVISDYGATVHLLGEHSLSATIGFKPQRIPNMIAIEMVILPSGKKSIWCCHANKCLTFSVHCGIFININGSSLIIMGLIKFRLIVAGL